MKLNKSEQTGPNTHELEISIPADQFKDAVSAVYRRDSKKYTVQGFRKGHAPRSLIEKMYGEDVFHYDAINDLFPAAYEEAVKEAGIDPVSRPDAEVLSASVEDGAVVKVTVTTKPKLKVGNYKGLKATRTVQKVDDHEVEHELEHLQERNARILTREGAAQDGDITTIDYEGSIDGVPFDGGKGEDFKLTLGSGQFIPGFEEKLVGHAAGEEFDIDVTFPEEYHAEDMAGKAAVFHVALHEVQYKELPALDDDFATEASEYDTLKELKDSIRKEKQDQLDKQADMETETKLVEQIVDTIEGEIPDVMYDNAIDDMAQDFAFRLQQQGLDLKTYLQYTGMDAQAFREGFKPQAEKQVKMRLALEAVVKQEGLVADEKDVDEEIARLAEQYKLEPEQVREAISVEEIKQNLAVNKAIDLIKSSAKITDEKPKKDDKKKKDDSDK